jgi:uncharacterized Zn finger protein
MTNTKCKQCGGNTLSCNTEILRRSKNLTENVTVSCCNCGASYTESRKTDHGIVVAMTGTSTRIDRDYGISS